MSFRLVAGPGAGRHPAQGSRPGSAAHVPAGIDVVDRRGTAPACGPCLTPLDHPALRGRDPRDGGGLRHRGALHPRGRLGPRGRPAGRPRGAGGVPRRRPARRRLARAEREGRDPAAAQGRRGRGVPLGRAAPTARLAAGDRRADCPDLAGSRCPRRRRPRRRRAARDDALAGGGLGATRRPGSCGVARRAGRRRRRRRPALDLGRPARRARATGGSSSAPTTGVAYFAALEDGPDAGDEHAPPYLGLREVGAAARRPATRACVVHAVALANWHAHPPHCPRCGARDAGRRTPGTPGAARSTAASTTRAPTRP